MSIQTPLSRHLAETLASIAKAMNEPEHLAQAFCALNSDEQAAFFAACARISRTWSVPAMFQWHTLGRHIRDQSMHEAANVIEQIAICLTPEEP